MNARALSVYVSASQISTFRDCPRKWAYSHIDGIKTPPNKSAELGLAVHKVLERWFTNKQPPDLNTREGLIAAAGLKHHPAPNDDMRAEHRFDFEFDNVHYLGYVDLHYSGDENIEEIVVTDHKSTSDFKWAKTEDDLRDDPQRLVYAAWATLAYGASVVRARWVYYRTNPPYASHVAELVETRDEIWTRFKDVHDTAKEITSARRRQIRSIELPQNFNACQAYGGCPYQERCHAGVSSTDKMKSILSQAARAERAEREKRAPAIAGTSTEQERNGENTTMAFLDQMRERAKSGANGAGTNRAKPGMDPAPVRAAYEQKEQEQQPVGGGTPAAAPAPAASEPATPPPSSAPRTKPRLMSILTKPGTSGTSTPSPADATPPPPASEVLTPPPASTEAATEAPAPARRPRSPKADQAAQPSAIGVAMDMRAVFYIAALTSGRSAKDAEEMFQAWSVGPVGTASAAKSA